MRRFLALALFAAALPSTAGVTYNLRSVSSGVRPSTIAGTVQVEGTKMRIDFRSGDGVLFKSGSMLLTTDGGKTIEVYDPSTKTYFAIPVGELLGSANAALESLGGVMSLSFANATVAGKDEGDGGVVEGYRTRKSRLDASFDINVDAMGQKMTSRMTFTTERWTTDKLPPAMISVFQEQAMHTGIAAVDKLIEAQSGLPQGFPLRQVSTIHLRQGKSDIVSTSSATVTNIALKDIPAARFTPPAGYSKRANPLAR